MPMPSDTNFMQDELAKEIHNVYIDLRFLQDLYIGYLLLNIKTETDYATFLRSMKNYNIRVADDPDHYFSELAHLGCTDVAFMERITDVKCATKIAAIAPWTDVAVSLFENHDKYLCHNKMLEDHAHKITIKYTLNIYPLKLTDALTNMYTIRIQQLIQDDSAQIHVVSVPASTLASAFCKSCQVFYIYDFNAFISNEYSPSYNAFFHTLSLKDATVLTPFRVTHKDLKDVLYTMTENELTDICQTTVAVMAVFADFKYLNTRILIEDA